MLASELAPDHASSQEAAAYLDNSPPLQFTVWWDPHSSLVSDADSQKESAEA